MNYRAWMLCAAAAGLCACMGTQRKTPFNVSRELPSTDGSVGVSSKSKSGNYKLSITLNCMPSPERLVPPAQTYVVWMRKSGDPKAPVENVGALEQGKDKSASLNTLTPLEQFEIWISTEASAQASSPTGQRLVWANVSSGGQ